MVSQLVETLSMQMRLLWLEPLRAEERFNLLGVLYKWRREYHLIWQRLRRLSLNIQHLSTFTTKRASVRQLEPLMTHSHGTRDTESISQLRHVQTHLS